MAMYTAVLVTPNELSQDDVIQLLERAGVVAFCGPGSLVQDIGEDGEARSTAAQSTRITVAGRTVQIDADVTDDGPRIQLSGVDCDLSGEMPGEYYLEPLSGSRPDR